MIGEHAQGANFPSECRPGSTEGTPVMWKAGLQETLEVIIVCDHYFGRGRYGF